MRNNLFSLSHLRKCNKELLRQKRYIVKQEREMLLLKNRIYQLESKIEHIILPSIKLKPFGL